MDITLKIAKQRAGETGKIYLNFNKELELLEKIENLINKIQEKQTVTTEEILGGFELC